MYPLSKDKKILKFALLSHKGFNKQLDERSQKHRLFHVNLITSWRYRTTHIYDCFYFGYYFIFLVFFQ